MFAIHITVLERGQPLRVGGRKLHIALARLAGEQYRRLSEEKRREIELSLKDYIHEFRNGKRPDKPAILLQPRFFATLRECAELMGHDPSDARHLKEHFTRLENCSVRFNSLQQKASAIERELFPDELTVNAKLLSSVIFNGRGEVSWGWDPVILGIMVNPRTYTTLSLELVRNARTYTALALYENCRRYKGTGKTSVLPVRDWQALLSDDGVIPAWESSPEFMRKIKASIAELEACEGCDIHIEPLRVKLPDKGSCLQFNVTRREQAQFPFGMPVPANRELQGKLVEMGLSADEASLFVEENTEEYVVAKLALLERASNVKNPLAWLRTAIAKDFNDEQMRTEAESRKRRERDELAIRRENANKAFAVHTAQRIREVYAELPEDARARFEVRFVQSGPVGAERLSGKAREATFFGWLVKDPVGGELLTLPEDTNLADFVLSQMPLGKIG